jgi:hypothetical protein
MIKGEDRIENRAQINGTLAPAARGRDQRRNRRQFSVDQVIGDH